MSKGSSISSLKSRLKSPVWLFASSILFVSVIVVLLLYFDLDEPLLKLLLWVDEQGNWAAILFILIMMIAVVFMLPGVFFTTGAGFVFGVVKGTIYIVLGTTLGAAVAFLLARYIFGSRAKGFILERSKLRLVNEEMARHDFKVVLLTRLIPFFPGKISNYFFGLTSFSFKNFVLASLIGFIPFSLHNVYLGSMAAELTTLGTQRLSRTPFEWGLYGFGFLATVCGVVYFNYLAKRALAKLSTGDEQTEKNVDKSNEFE